jgi:hypothetical protein
MEKCRASDPLPCRLLKTLGVCSCEELHHVETTVRGGHVQVEQTIPALSFKRVRVVSTNRPDRIQRFPGHHCVQQGRRDVREGLLLVDVDVVMLLLGLLMLPPSSDSSSSLSPSNSM